MKNELDDSSDTVKKAYASFLKKNKWDIETPGTITAKYIFKSHYPMWEILNKVWFWANSEV